MERNNNIIELYEPQAEQAVLAALLINGSEVEKVQKIIPEALAFSNPFYQSVYSTMLRLSDSAKPVDYITITSENKDINMIKLTEIINDLPDMYALSATTAVQVEIHAQLIADAYVKRQIYTKLQRGEQLDKVMENISALEKVGADRFYTPKDLALQVIELLEKDHDTTIGYPFTFIQAATNGIHKGQVVIVAGRPSAGKSTFIDNIALHVAKQKKKVLFATAEMSVQMIMLRLVTRMTGKNMFYHRRFDMSFEDRDKIDKVTQEISEMGLHIQEFTTVSQLEHCIKEKARDFDLVLVDYLQLLEPKSKWKSPYEKVTNVANELTSIAKKYNLPFVIAAQYSRNAERQLPTMADLKESGQIEQNADVILSLYSNKTTDIAQKDRQRVRIDILKNRNGYGFNNDIDIPKHFLWFNKPFFEFSEPTLIT